MVGHRSLSAQIDRPKDIGDLLGLDFAGQAMATKGVGDLVEALLGLSPELLLEMRMYSA
ncbi:MAG: hypothetical protein IPL62_20545 [Caulobacteraceae bacterium]|nr:hypothetical protein [Caulobacteraceae bacterium]